MLVAIGFKLVSFLPNLLSSYFYITVNSHVLNIINLLYHLGLPLCLLCIHGLRRFSHTCLSFHCRLFAKAFVFKELHWICRMPAGYFPSLFFFYGYFTKSRNSQSPNYILKDTASHNKPSVLLVFLRLSKQLCQLSQL